jgi:hypothetical protein
MSQEAHRATLRETQQFLGAALKCVRTAALAAALVLLGAVAVSASIPVPPGGGTVPVPCDFVTSGGFVLTSSDAMANFGAHGGCKKGAFWGHVNFVDHGLNYHVNSIEITGYLTPPPPSNVRDICGWATTNANEPQPVRFRVRLIDNQDGTKDEFGIRVSNGYFEYFVTTRPLGRGGPGGGRVQLHEPNPSTTGPVPPPLEAAMCGGLAAP